MRPHAGELRPRAVGIRNEMTPVIGGVMPARVAYARASWHAALESYLYLAFVGGLAGAPFFLGGDRLGAWGLHAVLFSGIVILHEASLLLARRRHVVALHYLRAPALLVGAAVAWIYVQTLSFVPDGWKHPIWAIASGALGQDLPGSISVNRDLTILALVRLLTAIAVFWTSLQLCRNPARAGRLLMDFALIGFVYSAYGLFAVAVTPGSILWFDKPAYIGCVTSTFVNRNAFASFAGMTLLAAVGVTVRLFRRDVDRGAQDWRRMLMKAIEATGRRGAFLIVMIFTIAAALFLSGSRGGITSTALGVFVLATLVTARRDRRRVGQIGTIVTACVVILVAFIGYGDVFVGRLDDLAQDADARLAAFRITLDSIRDMPLLGFGYGTFQDVFPMYRDRSVGLIGIWDRAHNTYLEDVQGLGVVFGGALLAGIGILVWRCARASVLRHQAAMVPIVATAASVLLGVHAFVDFGLQTQSVTLLWAALLGAGVAQSWSSRKELDVF
jgi:O-antigen ligase